MLATTRLLSAKALSLAMLMWDRMSLGWHDGLAKLRGHARLREVFNRVRF